MFIFYPLYIFTLITLSSADFTHKYDYDLQNKASFNFRLGNYDHDFRVLIDTNRPFSMVFRGTCDEKNKNCDNYKYNLYDKDKTGGVYANRSFHDVYDDEFNFYGDVYQDTLKYIGLQQSIEINSIYGQRIVGLKYDWDGVFGLGIGGEGTGVLEGLMRGLTVKQITIQEGRHFMSKKGKSEDLNSHGTVTFGKFSSSSCGEFKFVEALSTGGWRFKTNIQFGEKVLENQTVGFVPWRWSQVPEKYHTEYFNKVKAKNENKFLDIGFTINNQTYKITKEDYSWYTETTTSYSARIKPAFEKYGYDFAFGSDFLQHYCIALKADDDLKKFQIGIAPNNDARGLVIGWLTMITLFLLAFYQRVL